MSNGDVGKLLAALLLGGLGGRSGRPFAVDIDGSFAMPIGAIRVNKSTGEAESIDLSELLADLTEEPSDLMGKRLSKIDWPKQTYRPTNREWVTLSRPDAGHTFCLAARVGYHADDPNKKTTVPKDIHTWTLAQVEGKEDEWQLWSLCSRSGCSAVVPLTGCSREAAFLCAGLMVDYSTGAVSQDQLVAILDVKKPKTKAPSGPKDEPEVAARKTQG